MSAKRLKGITKTEPKKPNIDIKKPRYISMGMKGKISMFIGNESKEKIPILWTIKGKTANCAESVVDSISLKPLFVFRRKLLAGFSFGFFPK